MNAITVENIDGQRKITGVGKTSIRVATASAIANMSNGSLNLYENKVKTHFQQIHQSGNEEAIRAIDYLRHQIHREQKSRA